MPINSEIKQGTKIKPVPKPKPEIGVDTSQDFTKDLIDAVEAGYANLSDLDSFSIKAQTREQLYTLIDAMVQDGRVSAVLETYAEDITAPNNQGDIIWVESENSSIRDYVSYLLKSLEVNKNIFSWTYNLLKYGDVYLELFTEKDVDEENTKVGNKKGVSKPLNEDIKINISNPNNKLINYVEMVNNPAEMFELTKFGQTVSYIKAPVAITNVSNASSVWDNYMTYKMRNTDVLVYDSLKFVHGYLSTDNASRVPEEVRLFDNDKDYDNDENYDAYKIKKGQSILFNNFKIWRELSLLEDSILLNRLTRSGYINFLLVEVGDMPKDRVQLTLQGLKDKIEQKTALNSGKSMQEYTNPGPINNVIYLPTRNGVGNVSSFTLGGDVDPKQLTDLNWFLNSFYGNFRVPKQYFSETDDSTGFNGGTSLTIISSRYAKTIVRYQNAVKQFITDLINVFLVKRGLVGYINKFKICMQAPTTQEEIDRRDAEKSQLDLIQNVTAQFSNLFTLEPSQAIAQAKVLKTMLSNTVSYSGILTILDELILKWEQEEKEKIDNEDEGTQEQQEVVNEVPPSEENIEERSTPTTMDFEEEETVEEEPVETSEEEEVESENSENSYLPSFDELNVNGTEL